MERAIGLLAVLAMIGGCGGEAERPVTVPLDQVPAGLVKVAGETLPGIKFTTARKFTLDGQEVFEIRGKDARGKIREVELSAAGKVLEVE